MADSGRRSAARLRGGVTRRLTVVLDKTPPLKKDRYLRIKYSDIARAKRSGVAAREEICRTASHWQASRSRLRRSHRDGALPAIGERVATHRLRYRRGRLDAFVPNANSPARPLPSPARTRIRNKRSAARSRARPLDGRTGNPVAHQAVRSSVPRITSALCGWRPRLSSLAPL